jgi:DNA-binding SARP family transcriptional activator
MYHIPDALLVVLTCWLGLSLLVRAPHDIVTRTFAWFCFNLALYALSTLLAQLTPAPEVAQVLNRVHLATTVVTPIVFLHFIAVLTTAGEVPHMLRLAIGFLYGIGLFLVLYTMFGWLPDPMRPVPPWSRWGEPRFPSGGFSWLWVAVRVGPLLLALMLRALAYRSKPRDSHERLMRRVFQITSLVGVVGALAMVAARDFAFSPALPRTMILAAMLALAYAVLAYRALLPARVARRTFVYSLLGSLGATAYVGLVLVLERLVRAWLKIDLPLVSALALIVLIAMLEPIRSWARMHLDRRFYRREFDYVRLVHSLGDSLLEQGSLADQCQAALSVACRALGVQAGLVAIAMPDGLEVQARYGDVQAPVRLPLMPLPTEPQWVDGTWAAWPGARLLFPLRAGDEQPGLLVLGRQYRPQPFHPSEYALLDYVNSYLSLAIRHASMRDMQQNALHELAEQSKTLRTHQEHLAQQAARARRHEHEPATGGGLHVYALGPFRVERDGIPITRWGGDKAGTYQAEALFAFLFDRRGKGVTKDEVAEVIWSDLDIEKADSAFHRTLAGLRRTLEPDLGRGRQSQTILYHHERYWLEPACVAWSDSDALLAAAEQGMNALRQGHTGHALHKLEYACQLYRGDYMDDCPFFGDSSYVEEQRAALRTCCRDVQLALGSAYEAQGRAGEAISAYRRALVLSAEDCPAAMEGLERLQVLT